MYPSHPAADLFPLLEGAELSALAADIRAHGLREPVVLLDGLVLDGRNRLAACQIAGVAPRYATWAGEGSPTLWVISTNLHRRHLTVSQRSEVGLLALPMLEAEAKERQRGGQGGVLLPAILPEARRGEARDIAAAAVGVSGSSIGKAKKLRDAAPDVADAVRSGAIAMEQAIVLAKLPVLERAPLIAQVRAAPTVEARQQIAKQITKGAKERHKAAVFQAIASEPKPMSAGPYRVIVIDPPWAYTKRVKDVTHRARLDYPDMTIPEICALPVGDLACDDSILWLWTTNAFMRDAFVCLDAWGFTERTILTWAKDRMGNGDWLRGKTEHAIMAIKGKPKVHLKNQTTLLLGHVREHSRKPDEFYAMVESLCPGSRLELFAREPREGWARWGAETERFERGV